MHEVMLFDITNLSPKKSSTQRGYRSLYRSSYTLENLDKLYVYKTIKLRWLVYI